MAKTTSVMSHKNVTTVVWYILVQLSASNNTGLKVSGVRFQEFRSWTRRRPIGRDYAAAKDAECGNKEKAQGV